MAVKKKVTPETQAPEAQVEINLAEEAQPATRTVVLMGAPGQFLKGALNGVEFAVPCGVEVTVSDSIYGAVEAHIIKN
jgi:hypothetical protein